MPGPTTAQNGASYLQARERLARTSPCEARIAADAGIRVVKGSGRQFAACKARREDGFVVVWAARPLITAPRVACGTQPNG
jgi:hypothetical protein